MLDPLSALCIPPIQTSPIHRNLPQRKLLQPIPGTDDYTLELDYSSLSNFLACPRAAENYSVHSREAARPSSATDFGKLFHECEELRLRHGWSDETKAKQHALVEQHFLLHPSTPSDHRTSERMLAILARYNKTYNETIPDHWPESVVRHLGDLLVEVPFKIPLCSIFISDMVPYSRDRLVAGEVLLPNTNFNVSTIHCIYTGRIDAVLSDSNLLWVADHKTSSRGGAEFVNAFRLSRQTLGYVWAASKLLGLPIAGLIMNALVVKPPTKLLYDNTELTRHSYFYSQDLLDEWEVGMKHVVSDFIHCLVRGYFPQYSRSFKSPCAGCDYEENCTLPPHQRAGDLASDLYRNVTWNPMH